LAITLAAILAFAIALSVVLPRAAVIPVTGNQNEYTEFLRGEKVMYANPTGPGEAISAYHLGEKALYSEAEDSSNVLSAWHYGEKFFVRIDPLEAALLEYRQGEKNSE
jgi:hypothetical protein